MIKTYRLNKTIQIHNAYISVITCVRSTAFGRYTTAKASMPLVDGLVNYTLWHCRPRFNQSLLPLFVNNSNNVACMKDPQSFRGSPIFCRSRSTSAHLRWSRDINKLYSKHVKINSQRAVPNSENLTYNGHSGSLKVMYFRISGKVTRE